MMAKPTPAQLFETHHLTIYRYLKRMTRDEQLAEDLTQETFLKVMRARGTFEVRGSGAVWLFTIARNALRDHLRGISRRPQAVEAEAASVVSIQPEQHLALSLEQALDRLPETDRDVFLLRELGGLGYDEISTVCELSPDAVRSRIHRARVGLRERLTAPLTRARTRMAVEGRR
jgi:RNA polymerase sigma factor (sigma-70 family)